MGLFTAVSRCLSESLDVLVPDAPHLHWAQAMREGWKPDGRGDHCSRCGRGLGPGVDPDAPCALCRHTRPPWSTLVRLGPYREPLVAWIHDLKFHDGWAWGEFLGGQLAPRLPEPEPGARVAVCPVPIHFWRRWRRGYNQSRLIAQALARQRGWPCIEALRRTRYRPPQVSVAPSRRAQNVRGSFASAGLDLAGWDIWLVDDVKTTGSTLSACARLLRESGARSVHAAVIAVADGSEPRRVQSSLAAEAAEASLTR